MRYPLALLVVLATPSVSAQVHCESLSTPRPGGAPIFLSVPTDVSDDGRTVVGSRSVIGQSPLPLRWTAEGGYELLTLPSGFTFGAASGVSSDGQRTVADVGAGVTGPFRGVLWGASGSVTILQPLVSGAVFSGASAISDDGSTVVGYSTDAAGRVRATRWDATGNVQDLGGFVASGTSQARAVSADGSIVVGGARDAQGIDRAFRWTSAGGMQNLGFPGGRSEATHISRDGTTIFGANISPSASRLIRWTPAAGAVVIADGIAQGSEFRNLTVAPDGMSASWLDYEFDIGPRGSFFWSVATGLVPLEAGREVSSMSDDGAVFGTRVLQGRATPFTWSLSNGYTDLDAPPGRTFLGPCTPDGETVFGVMQSNTLARWRSNEAIGLAYCDPMLPNSTGQTGRLEITGTNILTFGTMELNAAPLPANATGYFLASRVSGDVFPVSQSQGRLCLGGAIGRFVGPGQVQNSGASGSIAWTLPTSALATLTGLVAGQPGETWFFQLWYRDANPTSTSNLTNGVRVTLQ